MRFLGNIKLCSRTHVMKKPTTWQSNQSARESFDVLQVCSMFRNINLSHLNAFRARNILTHPLSTGEKPQTHTILAGQFFISKFT